MTFQAICLTLASVILAQLILWFRLVDSTVASGELEGINNALLGISVLVKVI